MSRKQYTPPSQTHTKKATRKEQQAQLNEERAKYEAQKKEFEAQQQAAAEPTAITPPDEVDKAQLKRLGMYSVVGILLLLVLMYWVFISG